MNQEPSRPHRPQDYRVLLIDAEANRAARVKALLDEAEEIFSLETSPDLSHGLDRLTRRPFDIVLLALSGSPMPAELSRLQEAFPDVGVVILGETRDKDQAALAFRLGAQDYIDAGSLTGDSLSWAITSAMARMHGIMATPMPRNAPSASALEERLWKEVTHRRRVEAMTRGQNRVLEALAKGRPLRQILDTLILTIEYQLNRVRGSILLVDAAKRTLRLGSAPSFDKSFTNIIDGEPIQSNSGGCGRAAFLNESVIVDDIDATPQLAAFRPVAAAQGFRAFWSNPIRSSAGKVLGTLCLYFPEPRKPSEAEIQLIESIAHLTGIAIESQRSEQALRESEERFRKIFEAGPLGMAVLDTEGCFVSANAALCTMTGYNEEEIRGRACLGLTHQDDRANSERLTMDLLDGKMPFFKLEKRYIHKSGRVFWVNMTLTVIRHQNGTALYIIAMYENIDERKQANRELESYRDHLEELVTKRTDELQAIHNRVIHVEKLSAIGKLAATIAHEFNNPIYGIRNVLEKVQGLTTIDQKHKGFVNLAIKECQRVAGLISKLQEFNRPSSGIVLTMDIHEALDEMCMLIHRKLKERRIRLEKVYSPSMPTINAVPDQIRQVFLNLLQNAEEAIPNGGGAITLTSEHDAHSVRIAIRDSGQGIVPDNVQSIFDPFFTTKPAVKGTGLGLSTSYGIVKIHQGDIEVKSQPGKGSVFTVVLPISAPLEKISAASFLSPSQPVKR